MIQMPRLPNPSSIVLFFLALYACVSATSQRPACADNQYRQAMAKAVRNAAKRVLPSVVSVEIVGTAQSPSGEVDQDAPTSGVIIDTAGFVLASSIVVRRPAAALD